MPVSICVLLTARPGREELLADYEDQVLALLPHHDAHVAVRARALEGPLTEVQLLEFASEQTLADFQNDPRRVALSKTRDAAIASTTVIRIEPVS